MNKRKLLYLLLSVVLAFTLWMYVVTVVSPESEDTFYDVPVVLKNEDLLKDKELMLILEEAPTVDLRLTGNRSDLVRLNKSNITVMADLSRIYEPGNYELNYDVSYPADVGGGAIGLLNKTPSAIKLTVERKITDKPVPLEVRETGTVPADCIVQDTTLSSQQVLISGPKSVVDQIAVATVDVNMDNRSKSFTEEGLRFTLRDSNGEPVDAQWIETDVGSVDLTVVVEHIKELELRVVVKAGGGATEKTAEVKVEPQTIKVAGAKEDLADLKYLELGTVNLADYAEDSELTFDIVLPAGVKDVGNNETAKVTVKFSDLETVELTVMRFEAINVPQGMRADILTQSLAVKVRGPKEQMDKLTAADLKIVVDFKDGKPGNFNANAKVTVVNEAFASAGALGTYMVTVSLVERR